MSEKKKATIFNAVLLIIVFILTVIGSTIEYEGIEVGAKEPIQTDNLYKEPVKLRGTCYLPTGNKTASGTVPMQFRTVAGRREDLGKTCLVYSIEDGHIGQLIFIGVIEDTGGHEGLRNGTRIDIFMDSKEEMDSFIKEYGDWFMVQIIEGVG